MDWVDIARRWVPRELRYAIQRHISLRGLKLRYRENKNHLAGVVESDGIDANKTVRFGIVRNSAQYHRYFVQACLEMGIPFRVLDLYRSDWLEHVEGAECDVLLVWPDGVLSTWNSMIKERIEILEHELGYPMTPTSREMWMYEDKRRMSYWLSAKGIPHPKTWVFYDCAEAEEFVDSCSLPVVFKTNFGAASSGVRILKSRRAVKKIVRRSFRRGVVPGGTDWRDRQWGSVLLQEYLPGVREWRMVRIGDSFFCRFKELRGDFHSGSGVVRWAKPPEALLDFARRVTDIGRFRSMDVDVFETPDGDFMVNELQAVFGGIQDENLERGLEDRGRWRFDKSGRGWYFEAGDYYRNACANERILDALSRELRRPASSGGSSDSGIVDRPNGVL